MSNKTLKLIEFIITIGKLKSVVRDEESHFHGEYRGAKSESDLYKDMTEYENKLIDMYKDMGNFENELEK